DLLLVENGGDLSLMFALVHEHPEHAADGLKFFNPAGLQNHTIALQALLFAEGEDGLRVAVLIDQTAAEPVTGVAALSEAQFDQPALAGEYFRRQLAAVFTSIARFTVLTIVEATLPSFSNCSAQ